MRPPSALPHRTPWLLVMLLSLLALMATGLPGSAQDAGQESLAPGQVTAESITAVTAQGQAVAVKGRIGGADAGVRLAVTLHAPDGSELATVEVITDEAGRWEAAFPAAATDELEIDASNVYGLVLAARVEVLSGPAAGTLAVAPVVLTAPPETLVIEANFTSSVGWVKPGEDYPFRVTVRNMQATDGANAVVEIPPVDGTTWTSGDPLDGAGTATVGDDGTLTWDIGTIAAGSVTEPTIVSMIVHATADTLAAHPTLVWKNLSATAILTADGVEAASETHGPKVIPGNGVYETARYGDRPFPVVPVDYIDRSHLNSNSGEELATIINDPAYAGSTFNLFQEMSYGQLYPNGTVPSADIATADWSAFDVTRLHEPEASPPDCEGDYRAEEIGTPTLPERIVNGFYQLPGETQYYGSDNGPFPDGDIDSGCGVTGKIVYDAAAMADPEIDYNDYDTDKDGVVDFFMLVFAGCGGNGPSQRGCDLPAYQTDPYDNIWPHSSTLEAYYFDDVTGLTGYITQDRLTNLSGELLFYTDATYTVLTTDETDFPAYVRVGPYNVNPETSFEAASVISHEYGHSLGLPDYYASTGGVEYYGTWNLMASDYSQHMDLNGRQELGWVIPREIPADAEDFEVSMTESTTDIHNIEWRTPDGEEYLLAGPDVHNGDAWMAPLPKSVLLDPDLVENGASPTHVFWSQSGNDFGCPPAPTGHSLDIPLEMLSEVDPGSEVTLSFNSYWDIEWDFDYGFVLATTDNGVEYTTLPNEQGYTFPADDNPFGVGCQERYGNGLTGTSGAWEDGDGLTDREAGAQTPGTQFLPLTYDLSAYAGQPTNLRFAYVTDVGLARPGWYIDDVEVMVDGEVVYSNNFEEGPESGVVNGGCEDGAVLTGPCTDEWQYLESGELSLADHAYFVELRDRTGFDFDSRGQSDRGPITWSPGVSLGYTDEARGYGNTGTFARPNQTILDAVPVPFGTGTVAESASPNLDDAAWLPGSTTFSDFGDGWADNYIELDAAGNFIPWVLQHDCLEMDVTSMTGQDVGPSIPPGNLEADVSFTRGEGCGERDYGLGGLSNTAPIAVAQTREATVLQGVEVEFDGSLSADDLTPRTELIYSWDFNGDGVEDATGETATYVYTELGTYEATLTVTDEGGLTGTDTIEITVVDTADQVIRVNGVDRVRTSIALSELAFDTADTVVLSRADAFPDALAGAALAAAADGPVLLNPHDVLDPRVAAEISRLGADTVYVTGGELAISAEVADELEFLPGVTVERLGGATRLDTAAAIALETAAWTGATDQVILSSSETFADALSASNLTGVTGAPVVLTPSDELAAATSDVLADLGPTTVTIIGGPLAISPDVDDALAAEGYTVERIFGPNRYDTAMAVAAEARSLGMGITPTFLASGADFPDALAAGPAAVELGGRLLLVNPADPAANSEVLALLAADADELDLVYIAGGEMTIPATFDPVVLDTIQTDAEVGLSSTDSLTPDERLQELLE